MHDLLFQIINELMNHPYSINSEQLAMQCGVSSKTIRRCIANIKHNCQEHGFDIQTKTGHGIIFVITDHQLFHQYLMTIHNEVIPNTPKKRQAFILEYLLFQESYVKLNDLANQLYVSVSQLNTDLKEVKKIIARYNLKIVSKPHYGILIFGSEKDKRQCMAQQYFYDKTKEHQTFQFNHHKTLNYVIGEVITPILLQENIHISDIAAQSLAIHLIIATERIKNQKIITLSDESVSILLQKSEYNVAKKIANRSRFMFQVEFPESEICYITQHLLGKRHFESSKKDYQMESGDNPQIILLVNVMLRAIFDHTKIDFFYDRDLKKNLILHMIPFINRIENNLSIHNPILDDIKKKYSFAFELATIGMSAISKRLNKTISEDEISYFALHLILALEHQKETNSLVNILIICSTGKATSQLIAYQIKKKFSDNINTIKIIEYYMLDSIDIDSYDYAFSTVPIKKSFPIPIIQINNLLDIQDFQIIEQTLFQQKHHIHIQNIIKSQLFFPDIIGGNREEILCNMCERIKRIITIPDHFLELVLEREAFSATDLVNGIAIPHPNKPITSETFVAVGILKHPVLWETKQVQIVFLISVAPAHEETISAFFELLSHFMTEEKKIYQFLKKPSYAYLIELLNKENH